MDPKTMVQANCEDIWTAMDMKILRLEFGKDILPVQRTLLFDLGTDIKAHER